MVQPGSRSIDEVREAILGFVAVRKNPEAKPWPLIAGIVGAVAALASAILFTVNIVNAIAWIEYYSAF